MGICRGLGQRDGRWQICGAWAACVRNCSGSRVTGVEPGKKRYGGKKNVMRNKLLGTLRSVIACALFAGCGGSYNNMPVQHPGDHTAQVSLSMTDAPPAGITVLTFEVSVT